MQICDKYRYTIYIWRYVYVTTFCSTGTPYVKGAGLCRPQPFFRSAAWAELSIAIGYSTGTTNVLKRKHTL